MSLCWNCDEHVKDCNCSETETYTDHEAICPYCGYPNDPCDSDGQLYDESTDDYSCDNCGKTFEVSVSVSYTYTCKRI